MRYRKSSRQHTRGITSFLAICVILFALILTATLLNRRLRPISFELAKSYGSGAVLDVINNSVSEFFEEDEVGYSDLVRLSYNQSGFVTSIEYDSAEINRLKLGVTDVLSKNLSKLRSSKFRVPVGSLFGDLSLSGRGPGITVRMSESAVPDVEMLSTFESVGMNQVRHEIRIRVTAQVTVYLPPESAEFEVVQDYVLAQTIIVGNVPSGYAFVE